VRSPVCFTTARAHPLVQRRRQNWQLVGFIHTDLAKSVRQGISIVLAIAAMASWFWQPVTRAVAPLGDILRTVAGTVAADSAARRPAGSERVTGPSGQAYRARAIETIRTGQRVLAHNPQLAETDLPDAPVDPASWVNIHLRMAQATGDPLEITLLRPVEWLAAQLAESAALDAEYPQALEEARGAGADRGLNEIRSVIVSGEAPPPALGGIPALGADQAPTTPWIFLALHELAAVGPAEVVQVEPCPPIEPGAGRLVTGTFSHHSGEVLDIAVDGLTEPIGCTGAHPFWSEDRQDFLPARELVLGETLRTESGTLRQITRITPRRGPPVPVFNLEVDAEHVYYVSVDGVLVHNACEFEDLPFGMHITGPNGAGVARPPRHHVFPQENREWFSERNFDIDRVTVELDHGTHTALHTMGWNDDLMRTLTRA